MRQFKYNPNISQLRKQIIKIKVKCNRIVLLSVPKQQLVSIVQLYSCIVVVQQLFYSLFVHKTPVGCYYIFDYICGYSHYILGLDIAFLITYFKQQAFNQYSYKVDKNIKNIFSSMKLRLLNNKIVDLKLTWVGTCR